MTDGAAIALVAPGPRAPGGQAVQAAALLSHLRAEGAAVTFIDSNPAVPRALSPLERVPYARTLVRETVYVRSLSALADRGVAIAFSAAHASFLLAPVPAIAMAKRRHMRVILAYHSGEADEHLARWGRLVRRWLSKVDAIVVPSEWLVEIFSRRGLNAVRIPNVVDVSRFRYRAREPVRPRLVCTRNFEPHYRVGDLIAAFSLVRRSRPDATLTLAGVGSEEPALRALAARCGGGAITFAGRVSEAAMPALLDSADVFVNASIVDNQPVSLLEAFAAGLPVVTTAAGGIVELAGGGSLARFAPASDPEGLARAVIACLDDPDDARERAARAREAALRHTWPRVRDRWLSLIRGGAP